jgi:hypothetical protein
MMPSKNSDLIGLLTTHWALIAKAYDESLSGTQLGEFPVETLKMLADIGVLDLMWINTSHDFSATMRNLLEARKAIDLNPDEVEQLIDQLNKQSNQWFTRSIQCNWK